MNLAQTYQNFKNKVVDAKTPIGDGQCVALVVNNEDSYTAALFPGVNWEDVMAPVQGANQLAGKTNQYLLWVENDHSDVNQLPSQGDIGVFGPTPEAGYSNTFPNPDGHCGVFDSATANGYALLQQNSPTTGAAPNVTSYPWNFRPCLGWYTIHTTSPSPANTTVASQPTAPSTPAPTDNTGKTVFLPPTTGPWHLYADDGPYNPAVGYKGILLPNRFGGLSYPIIEDKGNGIYVINTQDFGQGAIWTEGSDVTIS